MDFSLSRFWLLTRKQWLENRKLYGLTALALSGLLLVGIVILIFTNYMGFNKSSQENFFVIGLVFSGALFTSSLLRSHDEKHKVIQALLLPASTAEKLSVAIFYSLIIFPLAYTAFAYPLIMLGHYIDVEIVGKINTLFTFDVEARYTAGPGSYGFSSIENREKALSNIFVALPFFFIVQTLFLLFSVVFQRYAFIKTVILVTLLFLCGFYFNEYTAMLMLQNSQPSVFPYEKGIELMHQEGQEDVGLFKMYEAVPYSSITVTDGSTNFRSYANEWKAILPDQIAWIAKLCYLLLIIFLWTITFFRLRENHV